MLFKRYKRIMAIIFFFLFIKLMTLGVYKDIWWDSAVYIGMGKYMYSLGQAGLWENSRPIVWPLMLGFFWKIGFNVVLIGRVMEIFLGGLCILLTYLIGKKLFDEKTALLSSIFLAFSPTFFFFNGIMLTEVISTFFSLFAIYFFIDKKYLASGIFFGISFMTRFLQLIVFILALIILLMYKNKPKDLKKIIMGFLIAVIPFLIFNHMLYNNALLPFSEQIFLSRNSGWFNYQPISYYFTELLKENFLYLFSVLGVILVLKSKDANKKLIAVIFIIFFIFFNSIQQKEMRFLIVLLPYMYLLVSASLSHFLTNFKNKFVKISFVVIILISFAISLNTTYTYYKNEFNKNNQYTILQDKLEKLNSNVKVWISNPVISASSSHRIDELIYYSVFNEKRKNELIKDSKSADFIFVDSCDLACKPFDAKCESGKNELLEFFKQQFRTVYSSNTEECRQFIFQK